VRTLVTGHTGSLGQALVPLLLERGDTVIGVSRDELKQSQYPKHERLTQYLCDVRDQDRLLEASRRVDLIIHAAAMKRIESCDEQPEEAVGVNILGTKNVLFCQRMNRITRVILVSTDKSCLPITTYGLTKATAERLVFRNPHNVVCRYGNILGSRGSVLQSFVTSILNEGVIRVTDPRMTRYWWTIEEAAQFVLLKSLPVQLGGLCTPILKAYPVVALGNAIASVLGRPAPRVEVFGVRNCEKLHEDLRTADEGGALRSDDQSRWYARAELEDKLRSIMGGQWTS
jgi:UDP-N-acetylglucosamine 4,6-dehydratase